jgi:hypothetical protein
VVHCEVGSTVIAETKCSNGCSHSSDLTEHRMVFMTRNVSCERERVETAGY